MTRSRLRVIDLITRHLRTGVAASIMLALLVGISTCIVSLIPRQLDSLDTAQLRHTVAALPAVQRDLTATGVFGAPKVQGRPPATAAETFGAFSDALTRFPAEAGLPLRGILKQPQWVVATPSHGADPVDGRPLTVHPVIALGIDPDWMTRVRLTEGTAPTAWHGRDWDDLDPTQRTPIDIAVSAATAQLGGLRVGDVLAYDPAPLRIVALYTPKVPSDSFWAHQPYLDTGNVFISGSGPLLYSEVFVDPGSAVGLRGTLETSTFSAWFPLRVESLEFTDAGALGTQARQLKAGGAQLTSSQSAAFAWEFPDAARQVQRRIALVTSLLALAASGPIGVVLAVFALGVQAVIDRRRAALSLMRSRGGSSAQVRLIALIEGLLISVPAVVIGYLVAGWIVPGDFVPARMALPAVFALTPPVLFTVFATRSPGRERTDLRVRSRSGARWVVEVAVIGLAALSLFLLFRRGLARTSLAVGVDPLLVATPLLLSLAVCVVVLRLYPALMGAVHGAVRSGRGAVGLVGAARATRTPALGFVAALALIVGISTAVFSMTLSTTVRQAVEADARLSVGADLRVDADHLDPTTRAQIAALPGVAASTAFQSVFETVVTASNLPTSVTVVIAQLDQLHRVRPDLALSSAHGTEFPVYLSRDLARELPGGAVRVNDHPATVVGQLPSNALAGAQSPWLLIDAADADRVTTAFDPDGMLVALRSGAEPESTAAAITRLVRTGQAANNNPVGVDVVTVHEVVATATAEPVISALELALLLAAIASALLSMLAVVLAAIASSGARNRLIGVLRILGLSPRQVSGLAVWELVPITLTAVLAGTLLGFGELWIVTSAVDLRPFLAGLVAPTPTVDPVALGVVVVSFVAVVALAGLVAVEISRRTSPASSIKMGVE